MGKRSEISCLYCGSKDIESKDIKGAEVHRCKGCETEWRVPTDESRKGEED